MSTVETGAAREDKCEIPENMPAGTEVLKITAMDPDNKDGQVVYSIVGGDGIGSFAIDASGKCRPIDSRDI